MKRLVLVGAGHAHALVLKQWRHTPLPGVELVLASPAALAPYSGMVPGWLAGTYRFEDICIDFRPLAAAVGARLLTGELEALDAAGRQLHMSGGERLSYDLLSLNVGSTLRPPALPPGSACKVLALRPLAGLQQAWDGLLATLAQEASSAPLHITTVGGGAAGVESLLAVLARLRRLHPGRAFPARLLTRSGALLPDLAPGAQRAAMTALVAAGVTVVLHSDAAGAGATAPPCDLLMWAAGAQAHAWQVGSGLAVSADGFIRVNDQLRSLSHPEVFAAGDCSAFEPPLPKAGVYAVRMGPVLAHNLHAALAATATVHLGTRAETLRRYVPQHRFLALLATADGRAIASRGRWSASGPALGRWLWRWKDHIDRKFLAQFAAGPTR